MVVGKVYTYNPDGTKKGLEVKYRLNKGDELQLWFPGTNSGYDWFFNFVGAIRTVKIDGYKYHRKWRDQARRFYFYFANHHDIRTIKSIKSGGHSAGCPQLLNFLDFLFDFGYDHIKILKPALFASPLRRNKDNNDEVIGNHGDLVLWQPTFWKRHTRIKWTTRKRTWNIIKNHIDYEMSAWKL